MKEYKAIQKYLLQSPRKIRLVVALIKKMKPVEAVEKLPFVRKRAALDVAKVIKAAMASARAAGVSETDLIFKEIQVGEGPRLKRGRPVSRGQWHPYKKRMAHIRVILTVQNGQISNPKSQTNSNEQKPKIEKVKANIETKKVAEKKGVAKNQAK